MRALVLIALALAGPAHAQQRGVTLIPAEPAIDRNQRGVTFVPQGATAPVAPPRWAERLLKVTGLPEAPAAMVAKNDAVLRTPVTHAVTGELTAPMKRYGDWMSGIKPLPIGTKFYATQLGHEQVWCAPQRLETNRWSATCFHPILFGRYAPAQPSGDGLFVTRAQMHSSGAIEAPSILMVAHDFGQPMRLTYRFTGWSRQGAALESWVEHDGGESRLGSVLAPRQPDGSARFEALGSELRLTPAGPKGKEATVEVVRLTDTVPTSPF